MHSSVSIKLCSVDKLDMKILIVDDEVGILEILTFFVEENAPKNSQILQANGGKKAIEILNKDSIDLCICDHNMPVGMGPIVLDHIIKNKLPTKFVLCSTVIPSDDPVNYPAAHIFANVQKPEIFQGIETIFEKLKTGQSQTTEVILDSTEFLPVTTDFLNLLLFAPSDVYIRLSDKKMVKCLNRNSIFTKKENQKYHDKGITTLYLKTENDKTLLLSIIKKRIREFLTGNVITLANRLALSHHQICEMIKLEGMTPEHQEMVKETITQSAKIISSNDKLNDYWERFDLLGDYPSQVYTLQILIASMVLKKLDRASSDTMMKISLAAFLQDITLDNVELLKMKDYQDFIKNKNKFTDEEQKKFLAHPQTTCDLIAKCRELPEDVDRIILEQHEAPNGNGFPKRLNANQTTSLSCLLILSGLMAKLILEKKSKLTKIEFVNYFQQEGYNKGNYKEVFDAIRDILL
jgi:response regulator RpfG family c-di-GMP phosphodiesterase